jgi:transcriptional regulator with XRE-family HTH domain
MSNLGNKKVFSRNLKHYMTINNKGRNEICESLKIPYTTFTDWEKGNIYPRIDKIEMLANYFKIQKSDLIEDKLLGLENDKQESLTADEKKLIAYFKLCDDEDKKGLLWYAEQNSKKNTIAATDSKSA